MPLVGGELGDRGARGGAFGLGGLVPVLQAAATSSRLARSKLRSINPLERATARSAAAPTWRTLPNDAALVRLAPSFPIEQNDEWLVEAPPGSLPVQRHHTDEPELHQSRSVTDCRGD